MDDQPVEPPTNPPTNPPSAPPANPWTNPPAPPFGMIGPPPDAAPRDRPPRRRASRLAMAVVVIAVLAAVGGAVALHQSSQDEQRAQAQADRSRSDLDEEQATAVIAHDQLSHAVLPGRALDAALTKPMATIQQLNALDKNEAAEMATLLHSGEQGIAGIDAYNRAVDAANADATQSNNLFQQMIDQSKDLPVD